MFDSNGVPTNGMLYIYATADVVTEESAAEGMPARSGWVSDLDGSDVWDNRNYVEPLAKVHWPIAEQDDADEVRDVLEHLGAVDHYESGTYYAADPVAHDYTTNETWSYALHAFVKHNGPDGWVETPIDVREYIRPAGRTYCTHGGLIDVDGTVSCMSCDWCPRCEAVREYRGEVCACCGRKWGSE